MRTIKFRGKQLENIRETDKTYASEKGTWRYGTYKYIHKYYDGVNAYMICDIYGREIMCDKNTIGQFTGLHDKNGVEIYEGDVVTHKKENFIVVWFQTTQGVGWHKDNGKEIELICPLERFEIIGNIHDKEMEE